MNYQQSKGMPSAPANPSERRVKERTRVNFLLTEDGFSKLNRGGENDPGHARAELPVVAHAGRPSRNGSRKHANLRPRWWTA